MTCTGGVTFGNPTQEGYLQKHFGAGRPARFGLPRHDIGPGSATILGCRTLLARVLRTSCVTFRR